MKISVIIPTYNGEKKINQTLSDLAAQSYKDFEVIVVIDGSTDNTASVVKNYLKKFQSLKIIEQKNQGRAGSRNSGAKAAQTPHLIFFDDDVAIPDSVVLDYSDKIDEGHLVIAGGLYPVYRIENEFSQYASYLNRKWNTDLPIEGNLHKPYLSANNFYISKELFERMGGFNGLLTDAEDFDLAIRLFERSQAIFFSPNLKVGHFIQQTFQEYALRQVDYKRARKALLNLNPAVKKYISPNDPALAGLKTLIRKILSRKFYLALADAGVFKILPRKFRHKLYDVLLTSFAEYAD